MTVLITGGNGFIGRRVTQRLRAQGVAVVWASRTRPQTLPDGVEHRPLDLAKAPLPPDLLTDITHIIHLAAREDMPLLPKGDDHGDLMFETNVRGTHRLLQAAKAHAIEKIVVVTAIWSFGWDRSGQANDGLLPQNIGVFGSAYALNRYQTEFVCLEAAAQGLPVVIAAPSIVVGAGDTKVAGPAVRWSQRGWVRFVPSGGTNCIDVEDVAQGLILALDRGQPGKRYLFVNENLTWQHFFTLIATELGVKPPRILPNFMMRWVQWGMRALAFLRGRRRAFGAGPELLTSPFYFSSTVSVQELGLPQTPIKTSLQQTISWVNTGQLPAPKGVELQGDF